MWLPCRPAVISGQRDAWRRSARRAFRRAPKLPTRNEVSRTEDVIAVASAAREAALGAVCLTGLAGE